MGNSGSTAPPDSNDVLVHSFQLDADTDYCSLPICCPGKQAMFHPPKNFSSHLTTFIPHGEGVKMIEEINSILRATAFPNRQCNLFFFLCMLASFSSVGFFNIGLMRSIGFDDASDGIVGSIGFMMAGLFLPYVLYFGLMIYKKVSRKTKLLSYVQEWNEKKNNGVFISLGGGGNVRGVAVGSETGGNYENFYMATWDPKSLLVRGYLHVFVNYQERANWCQQSNVPFVAPVPPHQQTMLQQIAPQAQASAIPAEFQVPAGYALVAENYQPPQEFQVPAGYALVPMTQDLPPNYDQANKM